MWQNHLMARGPELSLGIAEGRSGSYQFSIQLHPSFSLLLLGQPSYFLWKAKGRGRGELQELQYQIHDIKYTVCTCFQGSASNHILMPLPCFHTLLWEHLPASDKRKLQAGICKCTECGSCSIPPGINRISISSTNGGLANGGFLWDTSLSELPILLGLLEDRGALAKLHFQHLSKPAKLV